MFLFILIFFSKDSRKIGEKYSEVQAEDAGIKTCLEKRSLFSGGSMLGYWKCWVNCLFPIQICNAVTT